MSPWNWGHPDLLGLNLFFLGGGEVSWWQRLLSHPTHSQPRP